MVGGMSSKMVVRRPFPIARNAPPHFAQTFFFSGIACTISLAGRAFFSSRCSRRFASAASGSGWMTPCLRSSSFTGGIFSERWPKTWRWSFSSVVSIVTIFSVTAASAALASPSFDARRSAWSRHSHW